MQHLCERRGPTIFQRSRPQRFPSPEGCVVTTVPGGVNEFVVQNKSGVAPPLGSEQAWMKVNDADVFGPQGIGPNASHPSRNPMAPHRSLTKHAQRDASEDHEIRSIPRFHRLHALEDFVLQRLKKQGLLRRRAQNTTPQDQRW
tara:strand:+ start:3750 stop:4181 length:432 start_codon:yes stop_codon:yes gene_type:complete